MFVGSMAIYKQVPFKFSFVMKKRFIWIENDHPSTFFYFLVINYGFVANIEGLSFKVHLILLEKRFEF